MPAKAPEVAESELKKPEQFRLIGTSMMRIELPQKVNGSAQYSIDVQVPGMLYGAILRAPVEGSGPGKIDDAKARRCPASSRSCKLPYGVGVIADKPWAAFNAKAALDVTWTRTGKAWGFDSDKALVAFAAAARDFSQPTKLWGKEGDAPAALQDRGERHRSGIPQRSRLSRPDGAVERGRVGIARRQHVRGVVRRAVEDHRRDASPPTRSASSPTRSSTTTC